MLASEQPSSANGIAGAGGAGLEMCDDGLRSVEGSGNTFQDNWGPAVHACGDVAINLSGIIDNPAGGRVEQEGYGYQGARTFPRACIRAIGTLRRAQMKFSVIGGGLNGPTNRPHLLHISGGGIIGSRFDFKGSDLSGINPTLVVEDDGSINAKRWNCVTVEGRMVHGFVTEANLADPTHGINDGDSTGGGGLYRQDDARLRDGCRVTRNADTLEWTPPETQSASFATYDAALDHSTDYPNALVFSEEEAP